LTVIQEILAHEKASTTSIDLRSLENIKDDSMKKLEGLK